LQKKRLLNKASVFANIAAVDAVITLEGSDVHFKQACQSLERSSKIAKKLFGKDGEKKFADIISKVKKGNLAKEEKLVENIPESHSKMNLMIIASRHMIYG